MLTKIGIEFESSELIIPFVGASTTDSLLLRKITGLSPPDPTLFIGDYSRDGGIYQGRRVGRRNVVMTFDLNPNPALGETVSGLRELLYSAFLDPQVDSEYVKLNFYNENNVIRYAIGYTEKFETEVFESENVALISLICPDPYLRADVETVLTTPTGWSTVPFSYDGTAETGFQTTIRIDSTTSTLTLSNNGNAMVITRGFSVGDLIHVNTVRGSRALEVSVPPSQTRTSIMSSLSATSPWLELHSKANTMTVYGATTADIVASIRELRYVSSHWGM